MKLSFLGAPRELMTTTTRERLMSGQNRLIAQARRWAVACQNPALRARHCRG